jgi:23S rRNA G2445 N2-methylase RlmL
MADFLALTSRGLIDVLAQEVESLGFKVKNKNMSGVLFDTNWEGCYRANLQLRTATRIIKPILDFPAYDPEELYNNVLKHDFTKYIPADGTFAIDATVRESSFHDQRFVALKVKDAIADQFRQKFDIRPDVDTEDPDLTVVCRIVKNQVSLAINTSGPTLSTRGYRSEAGEAPLREHLGAALVKMAGGNDSVVLVDPMCGSGTFLIEAALMARNVAPGTFRKKFGFQTLNNFNPEVWDKVLTETMDAEKEYNELKLFGFDMDGTTLSKAKRNAERAGVDDIIQFEYSPITTLKNPTPDKKGILIVNPPYGERMGVDEQLKDVYKDLAYQLKREFIGWTCWILSGNEELTRALKLKATRRIPVFNGNIECRFLEYVIK